MTISSNLLQETTEYYQNKLKENPQCDLAEYLKYRNLSNETIEKFGIGISPYNHFMELITILESKGYTKNEMLDYGTIIDYWNSPCGYIDQMSGRITMEIRDYKSNLVGFGGRRITTDDDNEMKYINTQATPYFSKKNVVFNLDKAKYEIDYFAPKPYLILVEGYFDVMTLYDRDIKNVVAPMGTSLTTEQCKIIRLFTDYVMICMDNDKAGKLSAEKSKQLLRKNNIKSLYICWEDTDIKDVDEYINKKGIECFKKILIESEKKLNEI